MRAVEISNRGRPLSATPPLDGQLLRFKESSGEWFPSSVVGRVLAGAGVGVSSATGDVTITNSGVLSVAGSGAIVSSGGQSPVISLGTVDALHGGTGLTSAGAAGQVLRSNGTAWTSAPLSAADLPDVSATYVDRTTAQNIAGTKTFASPIVGNVTGNAGSVTNGVYVNGSYANPTWLTSLDGAKMSGAVATATTAAGFTGALAGDVTGSQGPTVVSSLRSRPLSAAAPGTGQVLKFNGASWAPADDATMPGMTVTAPLASTGGPTPNISLSGLVGIDHGGTGSATRNFLDLSTAQTVGGAKTFTDSFVANRTVSVGSDPSATCGGTVGNGALRNRGTVLELCVSGQWRAVSLDANGNGATPFAPGRTCLTIKELTNTTTDGLYWIAPDGDRAPPIRVYCDMNRDGGGWTLLMQNAVAVSGLDPTCLDAVNEVNVIGTYGTLTQFDLMLGLSYWPRIGQRIRIEAGASPTSRSHQAFYDVAFSLPNYTFTVRNGVVTVGGTDAGFATYHAGRPFQTKDRMLGSTCYSQYLYPWWYDTCWSGSAWGSRTGNYQDKFYWDSSGTDYWDYGAYWMR